MAAKVVAAGFKRVVYFPYGFLADNAESQLEGRIALRTRPELESWHLPCLNESPLLIEALARSVTGIQARQDTPPIRCAGRSGKDNKGCVSPKNRIAF